MTDHLYYDKKIKYYQKTLYNFTQYLTLELISPESVCNFGHSKTFIIVPFLFLLQRLFHFMLFD